MVFPSLTNDENPPQPPRFSTSPQKISSQIPVVSFLFAEKVEFFYGVVFFLSRKTVHQGLPN